MTNEMEIRGEAASVLRIGFGWTWTKIGIALGVSGTRASQIFTMWHRKHKLGMRYAVSKPTQTLHR